MDPISSEQAEQIFPAVCHFKIIGRDTDALSDALNRVLDAFACKERVTPGNRSARGTYITYNVSVTVDTLETMRRMDTAFRSVEGVRMVL